MTSRNRGPNLPWMSGKRSKNCGTVTDDPLVFHQEIMNFVRYIRLNSEEKAQRNKIIEALTAVILAQYPSAKVH